ncbi:MAG: HpaII family restriction endonuclease [Betaproteobacteria bacterium]
MLTGNKGEWSEIYALLKVVADKKLYRGDGNLSRLGNAVLPIVKVLRDESDGTYEYGINQNIVIINGAGCEFKIQISEFKRHAATLLSEIKLATSASFAIPVIEDFIASFNCTSLKASSDVKSDIRIVLHDTTTCTSPELGFSIKSQLGSASTLLNAGRTTNFIYKLVGGKLLANQVDEINSIETRTKIKDRLLEIKKFNGSLSFIKTENSIFSNNLTLIDSALPKILAEVVYLFYTSTNNTLKSLADHIALKNPLGFDVSGHHPFYSYKIKRFLTDIALGMMPSKVWTGELEATGGYLVVKEDGEILCYHIYNRNDFEDYLFNNTKLDTASSSRHGFGLVYEDDGDQFLKLNLQIRFIK